MSRLLAGGLLLMAVACTSSSPSPTASVADPSPTTPPSTVPEPTGAELAAERLASTELPAFDLLAWSQRLGLVGAITPPAGDEPSQVGDRALFNVFDFSGAREVVAQLVAANQVVAMWLEDGVEADPEVLQEAAERFASEIYPTVRRHYGEEPSPGIDGDPRLHVLHLAELDGFVGEFSSDDLHPRQLVPESNQREMFYVSLDHLELGSDDYYATLAHEFQHLVQSNTDPSEPLWFQEGMAQLAERLTGFDVVSTGSGFLADSAVQLDAWSPVQLDVRHYGAAYLFALYLWERWGEAGLEAITSETADGMYGVAKALERTGSEPLAEVFADWTVANYLDDETIGDGRYAYRGETLLPICPRVHPDAYPYQADRSLPQWSAQYVEITGTGPFQVEFAGEPEVPLLPIEPASGSSFWWSNRGDGVTTTLTRRFDLTGVDEATLGFLTWFDLEDFADFGMVLASVDDGQTWEILQGRHAEPADWLAEGAFIYTGASDDRGAPRWLRERVNLTPFAGREVLVRFEYTTDNFHARPGWAIDDITIREIGYGSDAEEDDGWEAEGFVRTVNRVPQGWAVALVEQNASSTVTELKVGADGIASSGFELAGAERAVLVVAAHAPGTVTPATYRLTIEGNGRARVEPVGDADFADDFADPCSGWFVEESERSLIAYRDEALTLEVPGPYSEVITTPARNFSDVTVEATVAFDGDVVMSAGVMCRVGPAGDYLFEVASDGSYSISAAAGQDLAVLVDWTESEEVRTGSGAENHLSADCLGSRLTLRINGTEVASVSDSRLSAGDVGLFASSFEEAGARAQFDDVSVYRSEAGDDVVLFDDFSDRSGNWPEEDGRIGRLAYEEDAYVLEVKRPDRYQEVYAEQEFTGPVVELRVRLDRTTLDGTWGISCNVQPNGDRVDFTMAGGFYTVGEVVNGEYQTVVDWEGTDAFVSRPGGIDHVAADCGPTLRLTVNGARLVELDRAGPGSGDVSLFAYAFERPGHQLVVEDLVIRSPR